MTKLTAQQVEEVLAFWFDASDDRALNRPREAWFRRDDAFDAEIRRRFLPLWQELAAGELAIDAGDARAALAWLIAADQFPRNLFRGEARAFSSDVLAREGARLVISQGLDQALPPVARVFVYLPFEHSEDIADQRLSLRLFQALDTALPGSNYYDYAQRHERVIAEFGRFPHRNAALGRTSTPAELSYLAQPGAGF
ncbi:DUF924 family protein [Chromobacterium violaceum]|uniref:DUF924 family protein n=1 Tax=Chromobacterium violaceum TaxID=536 RepID=UPI00143CFFFB|nr:DUF924 family protein [Chromobacterium violaceum]MCD0492766.1 DUF924 domain-containing protein [Chromobacterium violaceum]QIY80833.1 DUF924 domain-containing protein [Chromobacterium violaceum]